MEGKKLGIKVEKRQVFCVLLGIIGAAAGFFVENGMVSSGSMSLERSQYGQGETVEELIVEGLEPEKVPIEIQVGEREYGEREAEAAFDQIREELGEKIRGENPSLNEVRNNLILPGQIEAYGISVEWEPENPSLIEATGEIHGENCPEAGTETFLTAVLKAGKYTENCILRVKIFPPYRTEQEARLSAFKKFLKTMDKEQITSEEFILPEQYEDRPIYYSTKRSYDCLMFLFIGLSAAVLLPLRDRQKEKEEKKKRERQMMIDYSEIVSKLVVFLGAGLPVRKAWERVVLDYEKTGKESRAAYEEMAGAYHMMQRGIPEFKAYAEFGSRCRILPYRKLSGLLEQNIKNGSEGLRLALETEMESAFEQQKNLARRLGEEASTKLLLPLFMMLMIVMLMISVPAFLSFGI